MMAKVVSNGVSMGTRVQLDDGSPLEGVTAIQWTAEVNDIARLHVTLAIAAIEAEGHLTVYAAHPATGAHGRVAKIVFEDGSEWSAP